MNQSLESLVAHIPPVARIALLRIHANPGAWRVLPGVIRKKLRRERLVVQNYNDEWELSEIGHDVLNYLTFKETKNDHHQH